MQVKIYITIDIDDNAESWEDLEWSDPIEAIDSALCDFNYRIEHLPGGYITDMEIK